MQEPLKPDAKPWFHNPWVWFLILIPFTSVCLSFTMLWVAVTNKDPEVQDDWYKDKKAVRQDFARDEYASALSIQAQYSHTGKAVKFVINSTYNLDSNALPASLTLAFSHPTDSKRDLSTVLQKQDDGSYTTTLDRELTGRYYLTLSNTVWRLKDMVFLPFSEPITIKPEPIKS
jgi:hypothetical protein